MVIWPQWTTGVVAASTHHPAKRRLSNEGLAVCISALDALPGPRSAVVKQAPSSAIPRFHPPIPPFLVISIPVVVAAIHTPPTHPSAPHANANNAQNGESAPATPPRAHSFAVGPPPPPPARRRLLLDKGISGAAATATQTSTPCPSTCLSSFCPRRRRRVTRRAEPISFLLRGPDLVVTALALTALHRNPPHHHHRPPLSLLCTPNSHG
jgi:hypothetical protein